MPADDIVVTITVLQQRLGVDLDADNPCFHEFDLDGEAGRNHCSIVDIARQCVLEVVANTFIART